MTVGLNESKFLNVRETARRLGVHENTIRNWVRDGVLPTARIPGSRFHRFDSRDVERLRQQRGASVSSVATERRTIGPELVDATQLSHWATTRGAQDKFPELMRRLLASTRGVTNLSVRAGDGVAVEGWDGRAVSTGAAYLPNGSLCLEFGVGGRPKPKADQDYEERRDHPRGVVRSRSHFIFVTPRRWSGGAAWAADRRAEGIWAGVHVLDADDLEGWLQATPAVHHWISEHLGRRPRDAKTLEQWWAGFQAQTNPPLPLALFLAGRERQRDELTDFFGKPPAVVAVQAAWRDEAIAFICATMQTMDGGATPVQPPLLIASPEVWDRVVVQPGRMTLVPLFDIPDIAAAQERGHHVVLPLGGDQVARGTKIELPRPHRQAASEALGAAGVSSDRAYHLAALARRSMPSLVRTLARDPRLVRPPWSQLPDAAIFAPLVLVGAWTQSEDDTDLVRRMVDQPWLTIERTLFHWQGTEDPPFVQASTEWHLASPEEAFLVLRDALAASDLERWREVAVELLLETDPTLELPAEERPTAGVIGVSRRYSSVLRRGVADGVALVGSIGTARLRDGVSGADHAHQVAHALLSRANADKSGRIWHSLADVLPLLAEGAPDTFLDALHDDLDKDEPLLATMFQDRDQSSWLYSSSPHTGLLWAIETLCWSSQFLLEATRALARLQIIDPGGRLSNRPLESLQRVLAGWIRHTAAPLDVRMEAVGQICRQFPDVGWQLVLALWPSHHSVSSPPSAPRYRDWKPESQGVPISEWIGHISHLVQLAIDLAGSDLERWAALVKHLGPLPPADRDRLLDALESVADLESSDPEQRVLLWEHLHKEVARHQRFHTANWAMDNGPLSRMQAIADRLEPTASVERFGYLFDWDPDLPDVALDDHETYDAKLLELRTRAIEFTLRTASIEGLRDLAERSPVPSHLGWEVGVVAPPDLTPELLTWLDSENPKLRDVAAGWASRKLQDSDVAWLREALALPQATTAARRIALALSAPSTSEVWDTLTEVDADLLDAYWAGVGPWRIAAEDAARAARELLAHDRAWVAVNLLAAVARRQEDGPTSVTPGLVEEVLTAALAADPTTQSHGQSLGYHLGVLLDYLKAAGSDSAALAQYEFMFFRLLDDHREPKALFATLSSQPALFVDLVSRVYRGKDEPRRQLDEKESALAQHAWWVLAHWRGLPGLGEDGAIDSEHLGKWIRDTRLAFADSDRADIGDEQIGQVLAKSPLGTDGIWPSEPVRELIETIGSRSIESGVHLGVVNDRGITSRDTFDGGQQERDLAAQYRQSSKQTAGQWPRTSRILRGLAEGYERDAQREDERAEIVADTE